MGCSVNIISLYRRNEARQTRYMMCNGSAFMYLQKQESKHPHTQYNCTLRRQAGCAINELSTTRNTLSCSWTGSFTLIAT